MILFLTSILDILLLTVALSVDSFVASLSYGANKIKISILSTLIINILCSTFLGISLFLGNTIIQFLHPTIMNIICFLILFVLGITKLFDSTIKNYIKKNKKVNKKLHFSFSGLKFVLNVYANPKIADSDNSRSLSSSESVFLAIAMSLDSMVAGVGAAFLDINISIAMILSFIIGVLSLRVGCFIGNKISKKSSLDLSWISGVLFIILSIFKIL